MKLQQLSSLREVAARGLNLSRAAEALNTSQSGLTRQMHRLEQELGVPIFVRNGKRLVNMTPAGRALMPIAGRALEAIREMQKVADELASGSQGHVTVATHDTHARYVLPRLVERFLRDTPEVRLRLRQGSRTQVAEWVRAGEADFSIAARPREPFPDMVFLPSYQVHRVILTRLDHSLARRRGKVSLAHLAQHPLITYGPAAEAAVSILQPFEAQGLPINVVFSATDADIMKSYVRTGLGVGIVADLAYDRRGDRDLRAIDARHLFPSTAIHIGIRRGDPPGRHARRLIGLLNPVVARELEVAASKSEK